MNDKNQGKNKQVFYYHLMECKGKSSIITFVNFCISKYRHKLINKDKINDKK